MTQYENNEKQNINVIKDENLSVQIIPKTNTQNYKMRKLF